MSDPLTALVNVRDITDPIRALVTSDQAVAARSSPTPTYPLDRLLDHPTRTD